MADTEGESSEKGKEGRSDSSSVDLGGDVTLLVDISDAISETDKVKFTVHTKTILKEFQKPDFSVVREHEEFIWLHDTIEENEAYNGLIIPPAPPKPDFEASREKLRRLGDGEATMTRDEFSKMKAELEAEYLATFKKTVAMHEVFLCRLASHSAFRNDINFRVFLEFEDDLMVRGKNKKERLGSIWKGFTKSADEVLLSGQKDVDDFFEHEKTYLVEYHTHIRDTTNKAQKLALCHKNMADTIIKIASTLEAMATVEKSDELHKWFLKTAEGFEKVRKLEGRVSSDSDLKLTDTLRYFQRDTQAAKDLLYRRMRCLANYEGANKNLERARGKNKDVPVAELAQTQACERFEKTSEKAKVELLDFKKRRVVAFKKNLTEMAELQVKHAKAHLLLMRNCTAALKEEK